MRTQGVTALIASLVLAVPGLRAQQPDMGSPGMHGNAMKVGQEMMARMDSMDLRLDQLVKEMNAAGKTRKLDAVIAVINELVAQRHAMWASMTMHMKAMRDSGTMGMMMGPGMNGEMAPGAGMGPHPRAEPDPK